MFGTQKCSFYERVQPIRNYCKREKIIEHIMNLNCEKILHYCWFGPNPIPYEYIGYMDSWKRFCPEFKMKCWNENNFDVNSVKFVKDAYSDGKWAFVSDYVRFYALYNEGGLYVDTDVEFIQPIDDLLSTSFMGFESCTSVAPGLILFAKTTYEKFFGEILDIYNNLNYSYENRFNISSPKIVTDFLVKNGLILDNTFQVIDNLTIYPMEYFQPWGENWKHKRFFTQNTRTIHHYKGSWLPKADRDYYILKREYGISMGKALFKIKHPIIALNNFFKKNK